MNALLPAISLPCFSKPQQPFPPLKPKPPSTTFPSSFKPLKHSNSNKTQTPNPKTTQNCTNISFASPSEETLLSSDWPQLLKISIGSKDFLLGKAIHAYLVKIASQNDPFEGNNLINLYSKFNRLDLAWKVFDEMLVRNTITWTSLIKGCLENEDFVSGFSVVCDMCEFGEKFNEHTCVVILQACSDIGDVVLGEQIHGFVIKSGFEENVFVGTSLISMYSRSGNFDEAEKVFNGVGCKDLRCLNCMILEYGKAGYEKRAIGVFIYLISVGLDPNDYTFTNIISTCNVEEGKQLHGLAVKYGVLLQTSVGNAVITMYGKNGMVEEAARMFSVMNKKNLISWTALISGYTRNGYGEKAVDGFLELRGCGVECDSGLLATILDGCSECKNLDLGTQIHGLVIKLGYPCDINIGTALIDLYAKCKNFQSARTVFNGLSPRSTASFNAILVGFIENDSNEEDPMVFLSQLRLAGIKPDSVSFSRLLSLSANRASLVKGRGLHAYSIKTGFAGHISVSNALITMYAKCGIVEDAYQAFNSMSANDCISWNAIISAYSLHGQGEKALLLYQEMEEKGFTPDEITILVILQACTYSGLSEDGLHLFNTMESKYGIQPLLEHYACMVDLLGRAGYLSQAMDIINRSPFSESTLLWRTLVNVCKLCGDLNLGKLASKHLLDLSPDEAGSYVLVSNMYAGEGMIDEASKVRTTMKDLKLSKEAGSSWVEIDNMVHYFVASGTDHPKSIEIYARLDLLRNEMRGIYDSKADLNLI
jgi:pentatricopeptide repeat protein|uniref:Pentacotripeptide-repeat region of PRORP domain-containing protein n=1 Tax=Populus trichocarpa TaxID=3694 RepID=A0A2K1R562_POPTR|eukprot:XP_024449013.1 pentatricopeptide repeat-containing protein At2g33680 [Populus trichocarpa]